MTGRPTDLSRRGALRAGVLAVLAVPLAACSPGYDESPDPLAPLLAAAQADVSAAKALAGGNDGEVAVQVADARAAHATALKSEVDRLNRPKPTAPAPVAAAEPGLDGLKKRLAEARKQAEQLVPTLPRYRAGLLASIAAGCAGLQRIDKLGPGEAAATLTEPTTKQLPAEAVDALQQALAAEHAAIWVYGLVSAFLPANFDKAVADGAAEHVKRRELSVKVLSASGATPAAPEAAYVPPKPVTDQASAAAVIASAESDTAAAWLGVVDHTDDAELRTMALRALIASARRATPWRQESGEKPPTPAMPGQAG
ncbi:ferritin-like domain-containing protein [Amycolatopsis sp. H20-H5]|uniref:ferritin-like domain-containing protein n=1 Tax=Amycolatopsis sp. H20-H5 TaxID=3046309 RepID=UPI002DBAAD87|nr:ferritin-like domain-containing protein [Amycolatopsis sp. H20-H5]MEC3977478.1 ferritin-like domain-containing protein [Amycolatopsis sp. H20-H5]